MNIITSNDNNETRRYNTRRQLKKRKIVYSPGDYMKPRRQTAQENSFKNNNTNGNETMENERKRKVKNIWETIEGRIRTKIRRYTFYKAYIEVYEQEGWRKQSSQKLKPVEEIIKAYKTIEKIKEEIQKILVELKEMYPNDEPSIELDEKKKGKKSKCKNGNNQKNDKSRKKKKGIQQNNEEDDGIDVDMIGCSRCKSKECTDENDMLFCDYEGCHRIYHQQCQIPPIEKNEITDNIDDPWFCRQCTCIIRTISYLNDVMDEDWQTIQEIIEKITIPKENENYSNYMASKSPVKNGKRNGIRYDIDVDFLNDGEMNRSIGKKVTIKKKANGQSRKKVRNNIENVAKHSQRQSRRAMRLDYAKLNKGLRETKPVEKIVTALPNPRKRRKRQAKLHEEDSEKTEIASLNPRKRRKRKSNLHEEDFCNDMIHKRSKRQRKVVNYRKLYEEMFGKLEDPDEAMKEENDDCDWKNEQTCRAIKAVA